MVYKKQIFCTFFVNTRFFEENSCKNRKNQSYFARFSPLNPHQLLHQSRHIALAIVLLALKSPVAPSGEILDPLTPSDQGVDSA